MSIIGELSKGVSLETMRAIERAGEELLALRQLWETSHQHEMTWEEFQDKRSRAQHRQMWRGLRLWSPTPNQPTP